ncbi:hypothetical protein CEXT_258211 [Caerostris extrusa]|uniref:Uncharacterized protein n=1 Tax=Caerostris extrusa TaxID=172846 RepID=A0AAV4P1U7_CAEEX|nr:hypothetical protein CEXT_258211 [Caerostris extrusa]
MLIAQFPCSDRIESISERKNSCERNGHFVGHASRNFEQNLFAAQSARKGDGLADSTIGCQRCWKSETRTEVSRVLAEAELDKSIRRILEFSPKSRKMGGSCDSLDDHPLNIASVMSG